MKVIRLTSLLWILCVHTLLASQITVSGTVSGTWDADTVFVAGDIYLPDGQVLTITPGAKVIFLDHYAFYVAGSVDAQAVFGNEILFTTVDTTGLSNLLTDEGGWKGIRFTLLTPTNDSSLFEHCIFRYGKAVGTDTLHWYGGAVCVRDFNKIRFSHCLFTGNRAYKNGGAVYLKKANIRIELCEFEDNFCGSAQLYGYGGGLCLEYSSAQVRWNRFTGNASTGVGGGLSYEYSNPALVNNEFYSNYSAIGGGLVALRSTGNHTIANNLFSGNSSLYFGGGIAMIETSQLFVNNTVVNNATGGGGGLYFNSTSNSVFKNCIVWGNTGNAGGPQVYIWDTFSSPEFYYCDIAGGVEAFGGTGGTGGGFIGIFENCLDEDPTFDLQGEFPFSLLTTSPCVDAGTPDTAGLWLPVLDLAGNPRFANERVDLGAYEVQAVTDMTIPQTKKIDLSVYPNPCGALCHVILAVEQKGYVQLDLYDLSGAIISGVFKGFLLPGITEFTLKDLSRGLYFLSLRLDSTCEMYKFLVR